MKKIRLLIADDHNLVREGLSALLETVPDISVIAETSNGLDTVRMTLKLLPDVILMDLVMPEMDGIQAIREIRSHLPDQQILVLTSFSEDDLVFQAIQSGAAGYILKNCTSGELVLAIRCINQGEAYMQPLIMRKFLRKINQPLQTHPNLDKLSDREKDVASLVGMGLTNKDIANKLVISERTVDAHVSNILKKLHLTNRTQIALHTIKKSDK